MACASAVGVLSRCCLQTSTILIVTAQAREQLCREHNELVASLKDEVSKMRAIQATSRQKQMHLDEESLQRVKAAEEAKKVLPSIQAHVPLYKALRILVCMYI